MCSGRHAGTAALRAKAYHKKRLAGAVEGVQFRGSSGSSAATARLKSSSRGLTPAGIASVRRRRRRRSMTIHLVIAVAKPVPVFLHERRRYGRIAEPGVTFSVRRCPFRNIALSGVKAIMVALLCCLRVGRGRWWVIWPWMRTPSNRKRYKESCHRKQFLHVVSS